MGKGEESLKRFLDGDENAFGEVLGLYFDNLTFFINGYLDDVHASEDIAIDAMTELAIHPGRFDFRSSLKTFLFSVGRHKALSYLRRARRTVPLGDAEANVADYASLEDDVIVSEEKKRAVRAMRTLPDDLRTVLHLVVIEEMSYREAGRVLGKSVKQVDNLLQRAKNALREAYKNGKEDATPNEKK